MTNALGTTAPLAQGGFNEDAFEAFLKHRDEPSWLSDRRREAFAALPGLRLAERPRRGVAAHRHPAFQAG